MSIAASQPATYGHDASIAKWSVAQYQQMIDSDILNEEDHVELLENYVVLKMPKNPPHDGTIQIAAEIVVPLLPPGWRLRVQSAVELSDSQPEPDMAVVRGNARTYLTHHPGPADIGVLIEVANTSLRRDTIDKARIYARAGVPVYWVLNLTDRRVEVFARPSGPADAPAYESARTFGPGDVVPLELDGAAVAAVPVDDLLP